MTVRVGTGQWLLWYFVHEMIYKIGLISTSKGKKMSVSEKISSS